MSSVLKTLVGYFNIGDEILPFIILELFHTPISWTVKWPFERLSDLQIGYKKVTAWITWIRTPSQTNPRWFQRFVNFTPTWGRSNLTNIFQLGLKPPTRINISLFMSGFNVSTQIVLGGQRFGPSWTKKAAGYGGGTGCLLQPVFAGWLVNSVLKWWRF